MGLISSTLPTVGQPRGSEETDVLNALQDLIAVVNGNIDEANAPELKSQIDAIQVVVDALDLPTAIRKTVDETVNNSTTLQDDDHLALPVVGTDVWLVDFSLMLSAGSGTPDWKFGFSGPAAATFTWGALGGINGPDPSWAGMDESIATVGGLLGIGSTVTQASKNGLHGVVYRGIYKGGGNDGTLRLRWAQDTANATDSKVLANSVLLATKVS